MHQCICLIYLLKGIFASDVNISGSVSVNGSLTVGGMAVTSTEIGLLDNITTIGVSQNDKVLTQDSSGIVTIGESAGNQVFNIASHNGINSGLKLNGDLVKASANDINKLSGLTDGTVLENKVVIADVNKDISNINKLSINSININGIDLDSSVSQLNKLNNVVDGTAKANSVLIADDNLDISSLRNITATGNLVSSGLDVNGNITVKSTSGSVLNIGTSSTNVQINDTLGVINFQATDEESGSDANLVAASIKAVSEGEFTSTNNASKLEFLTAASETATAKMTISSSGNVDIHGGDLNITGSQTVSEDMTVSGKLTIGTTEITGTTVAALDNLVGESSKDKVVTQNNEGKIKIDQQAVLKHLI